MAQIRRPWRNQSNGGQTLLAGRESHRNPYATLRRSKQRALADNCRDCGGRAPGGPRRATPARNVFALYAAGNILARRLQSGVLGGEEFGRPDAAGGRGPRTSVGSGQRAARGGSDAIGEFGGKQSGAAAHPGFPAGSIRSTGFTPGDTGDLRGAFVRGDAKDAGDRGASGAGSGAGGRDARGSVARNETVCAGGGVGFGGIVGARADAAALAVWSKRERPDFLWRRDYPVGGSDGAGLLRAGAAGDAR